MNLDEAITNLGDALSGAVDRFTETIFGPPVFERPQPPAPPQPRPRPKPPVPCKNCKWFRHGSDVVCHRKDLGLVIGVAEAERVIAESPRPVVTLTPRELRHLVSADDINPRHLAHVDDSKPGILGLVRHRGRQRRVIVEGHHRAFNARRARRAFDLYPLTEEETARCLR